jgi:hypothetical protein
MNVVRAFGAQAHKRKIFRQSKSAQLLVIDSTPAILVFAPDRGSPPRVDALEFLRLPSLWAMVPDENNNGWFDLAGPGRFGAGY